MKEGALLEPGQLRHYADAIGKTGVSFGEGDTLVCSELRRGRLVRLEADHVADRDFVAADLDSDASGNGRRLGEAALVDATSRIGRSGRVYLDTLLDENAAAHIAFGQGFNGTRTERPLRGVNHPSSIST